MAIPYADRVRGLLRRVPGGTRFDVSDVFCRLESELRECQRVRDALRDENVRLRRDVEQLHIAAHQAAQPAPYESLDHAAVSLQRLVWDIGGAETIYVEEWARRCRRHPAINHGYGALELILDPCVTNDGHTPLPVSQRDAAVAASVVQWLGTNCGHAFVLECERKFQAKQGAVCAECGGAGYNQRRGPDGRYREKTCWHCDGSGRHPCIPEPEVAPPQGAP